MFFETRWHRRCGGRWLSATRGFVLLVTLLGYVCGSASVVDPMKHDFFPVTSKTFDKTIAKYRTSSQVSVLMLYLATDKAVPRFIKDVYQPLAAKLQGYAKFAAMDCVESSSFCKPILDGEKSPTLVLYPPFPQPEKKLTSHKFEDVQKEVYRSIPKNDVTILKKAQFDLFMASGLGVPKVFFLSQNEKVHPIVYALANSLSDRMNFGYVHVESEDGGALATRLKVKKFPAIAVVRGELSAKNPADIYDGPVDYAKMFEFLNVRSETFVKGGGFSGEGSEVKDPKPWLMDSVPEMTRKSHLDICFKNSKDLCVIYISDGTISAVDRSMLETLASHPAHLGATYRFMWIDGREETEWTSMFGTPELPAAVVFNPRKRLRWTGPVAPANQDTIRSLMDMIENGDARFKLVPEKRLPKFTSGNGQKEEL